MNATYERVRMRMALWVLQWTETQPLSPPIWPLPEDVLTTPNQQVYNNWQATHTTHGDANQRYGDAVTQQTQLLHQSRSVWGAIEGVKSVANHSRERIEQVLSTQEASRQLTTHTQTQHWGESTKDTRRETVHHSQETVMSTLEQAPSSNPTQQTVVNLSPTIHLQATVYEQATVEALAERLGRLLEQELAISAERAYS